MVCTNKVTIYNYNINPIFTEVLIIIICLTFCFFRRRAWLKAAGREDLIAKIVDDRVRQQYRICEDHFEKTCIKFSKKRTMKYLLDSAFPTLNLQLYNRARFSQCETVSMEENQEFPNVCVIETSTNENSIKINYLQSITSCSIETDAKDIDCASESGSVQTPLQLAAINPRKRKIPLEVSEIRVKKTSGVDRCGKGLSLDWR